jgi:hypothetical protein
MAKKPASTEKPLSSGYKGRTRKILEIVENMAEHPNSTSNAIANATHADTDLVSVTRRLVRKAAGKVAHIDENPSVKSRGTPRKFFHALEQLGENQNAASEDLSNLCGLEVNEVDSLKDLIKNAGKGMD